MERKMLDHHQTLPGPAPDFEDYVTIIGPTMTEVMRQFRERHLGEIGYAITGRVERHRFSMADASGAHDLFEGVPMLAATFRRHINLPPPEGTDAPDSLIPPGFGPAISRSALGKGLAAMPWDVFELKACSK
jgi:hypothetical protein